jgi:hypothetical protein
MPGDTNFFSRHPAYYITALPREELFFVRNFLRGCITNFVQCQGGDSNPYGFLHQILSLARLPISPPWQIVTLTTLAVLAGSGKLRL